MKNFFSNIARSRRTRWLALLLAGLVLATGCRSVRRGEPIAGPMTPKDPRVANGQLVFMKHCHSCHPGGEGGLGPGINDKPLPRFLMKTQVRVGLGVMPEFPAHAISPDELNDLMAYIVALRHHGSERDGR